MITFGFLSIVHVSALAHEWQYFTLPMTSNISLTPQKLSISFPFEIVFSFLSKILTLVINLTYFTKERKVRRWSETIWRRPDHTKCPDWSAPGQKILASTMKLTGLADCNRSSFFYPLDQVLRDFRKSQFELPCIRGTAFSLFSPVTRNTRLVCPDLLSEWIKLRLTYFG